MAEDSDALQARANGVFRVESDRHEKGAAMRLIAAEAKATEDKTARLRKLREERDALAPPVPAKTARPARKQAARK
ncbi:hypothetical protein GCM10011390_45560 [Aureimonas endophytica]|uniref:Uncharacterized protein n=1 Tax=Aureimonas endophytica TaxID=2027858 RepID=A0A917A1I0_9HYPH|nr:hypothetical protein [Aureimonas endophytica]GGE21152.1 hypothetical protein GCM10011390_45560 [Aureimonas endophytica]